MLTQEYLKSILSYSTETGQLLWRVTKGRRGKKGSIAGGISKSHGYGVIRLDGTLHLSHRIIWLYVYGVPPVENIDHINGCRTDNRILNLRECSQVENARNQKLRSTNTSGYKGVSWDSKANQWAAKGMLEGKQNHLGYFNTPEEASLAYETFTKVRHKEFYRDTTQ